MVKLFISKVLRYFPVNLKLSVVKSLKNLVNLIDKNLDAKILDLLDKSIADSIAGNYDGAERSLLQAAILKPNDPRIAPHLSRVRFLRARSLDIKPKENTQKMLITIDLMNEEIKSNPIYVSGEFWNWIGKFHLQELEMYGIENFKRTVSHHYQNWLMISHDDVQVRQLFKTWPTNFICEPWFNIIEIPDYIGQHQDLNINIPSYPLANAEQREIYRVAVGLLWEFVKINDSFNVLEKLAESEIGNPIRIWRNGQLISSDLAHSVRERNMLLESLSLSGNEALVVGELGAGHGRLAEIFGLTTNFRYFIFDITPTLYVSQWYIKERFPKEKIFEFRHFDDFSEIRDELKECRFAFFTSNQIEKLPNDYFNLFINMNSLAEMRKDQIKNFLQHIDRLTSMAFLSRQQEKTINPLERVKLCKGDFAMSARWQIALDKLDDIHPEFFNQIWRR